MILGIPLPLLDVAAGAAPGWHLHLEAILPLVLLEGLYLLVLTRLHVRSPQTRPLSENGVLLFTLGILVVYLAIGTPLDDLADHYLFSAHMLQHLLLSMVTPPLLLLGMPGWLIRTVLVHSHLMPVAYILTRPLVAFALFNLTLLIVHLPFAMSAELAHEESIHPLVHLLLILTGMLMWWPVLGSVSELPRLSYGLQLVYLFVQSFFPTVLSAFIIFTGSTFYPVYAAMPRLWGLSAVDDQRIGGIIMKLGGGGILWLAGTIIFFIWFEREQREEPAVSAPVPGLAWEDVEDELARMGLTKQRRR